jgi:ABC-type multidrug transport system ATPase subunit
MYISHVLEVVEKVCSSVVIIYKGRIMANDSVGQLRDLMKLPSLEEIFAQLIQQEDMEVVARILSKQYNNTRPDDEQKITIPFSRASLLRSLL